MSTNEKNVDPLMSKMQNKQLSEDELEKINGGGLYLAVDPSKCPKGLSKYVLYVDGSRSNKQCAGCEHIKEFGNRVQCEFFISGNYEWEW
jgi:bacteriocin-like protein